LRGTGELTIEGRKSAALLLGGEQHAAVGHLEPAGQLEPHRLCAHLFSLAQAFTAFYDQCPVLRGTDEAVRSSRLALCELTLLVQGLDLLGVAAPEQM